MKLTTAHMEQFGRDGCLFFPGLFAPDEVAPLAAGVRAGRLPAAEEGGLA